MVPLSIIFAGSGAFGVPTLQALIREGHQIIRVITQPDRPAGRGRKLTPTPIALLAEQHALPLVKTANINSLAGTPENLDAGSRIGEAHPPLPAADVMVVIAFGQKISPAVVNAPRLGSVNLHASRLPLHRGAAPINWTILSGDAVAGNSIIRLADRMDAGAVLAMSRITIEKVETAGELHDRLAIDGADLMLRTLGEMAAGEAVESPQDETKATLAPKLSRDAAVIDWTRPADQIARQIRGLSPWPGCHATLIGVDGQAEGRVTLVRAVAKAGGTHQCPTSEILEDGTIAAGDGGRVEIIELQPEGKRPMALDDYRNGHSWKRGMAVISR